jgi:outer membrane protein OmpA-like peptidoglycan-associated protein
MRRPAILLGLLVLGACTQPAPPDHVFPVFFTQFSSSLDAPAQAIVARAAAASKLTPKLMVYVAGYADPTGAPGDVVRLSKARADAVMELLVADGVPRAQIVRTAVGTPPDSQPGVESRRVEIDIGI